LDLKKVEDNEIAYAIYQILATKAHIPVPKTGNGKFFLLCNVEINNL
jgi:hypothetical protein